LNKVRKKGQIEAALAARSAAVYADFLLPHLRAHMIVLDLGCGQATISMGVAEVVPHGRVLGVDIDRAGLAAARGDAATIGCGNLAFAAADGRQLPFRSGVFDAVLCHSMLETLNDPTSVITEVRRVMKRGGIVGAASVEYGGIILGGRRTTDQQRFYDIRQQLWRAESIAEPNTGRRLRGLFQEAGFSRVEATAHYISYGSRDRIIAFARDRAAECRDQRLQTSVARQGIASAEELTRLAASWEEWVAILEPSLLSRGVGYWLGLDRRRCCLRPSVKRVRLAKVRSPTAAAQQCASFLPPIGRRCLEFLLMCSAGLFPNSAICSTCHLHLLMRTDWSACLLVRASKRFKWNECNAKMQLPATTSIGLRLRQVWDPSPRFMSLCPRPIAAQCKRR
jgi:ubiquinone/menaquinone biosynthesis C-methylase UbiE